MAKKAKARLGAPTRAEKREQQMTDSFATLAEAMKLQAKTNAALVAKLEGEPKQEQTRTLDAVEEFHSVVKPPDVDVPVVIYKSLAPGLKQVVVPARIIQRSEGNYQIIPPVLAEFDNGTLRVAEADEEQIAFIDAAMDRRKRMGMPARFVRLEGEVAKDLADKNGDVKALKSAKVTVDTPLEALI